ncbi:MAG: amidohydrolase family protein [Anaerolineales bacterium]|nr:amidohydrolase family protein [Anaerolineales bacterium]
MNTYTIIKSKQLIVDSELQPIPGGIVIVQNDKITQVGAPESVEIPPDSRTIDCSEETVMPGMIDTHVHITAGSKYQQSLKEQRALDVPTAILRGSMHLRANLAAGVTTIRTLGDRDDFELRFRDAIESELIPGPRAVICIRALRPSHGTAPFLGVPADGPHELRKMIRENFSMGSRVIKLFVTNVCNGETADDYRRGDLGQMQAYSREELFAAIGEAHDMGLKVAGHAIGGPSMRWAMEAGIDSVEHANNLEEQDIEYFCKYGTRLSDPNLRLFFDEEVGFASREIYKYDWWREKVQESRYLTETYMPMALKAGVKICLAVDSSHGLLWREARCMVENLGASTTETLTALTKNNAELLDMQDSIGTIEPGKLADIISVKGDPLADITVLQNIGLVMKAGKEYKNLL